MNRRILTIALVILLLPTSSKAADKQLTFDGDSMVSNIPVLLSAALASMGQSWHVQDKSKPGDDIGQMLFGQKQVNQTYNKAAPMNVLVEWGGTNTGAEGIDATTAAAQMQQYLRNALVVGWRPIHISMLRRFYSYYQWKPSMDGFRDSYNATMKAWCPVYNVIYLDLDGAMSYATVWCNGQIVGGWPYGYSSWRVDLSPVIKPGGDNVIAIRLDNSANS
jgi:hypothetical protein